MKKHSFLFLGRSVAGLLGLLVWIGCVPFAPETLIGFADRTSEAHQAEAVRTPHVDSSTADLGAIAPDRAARRRDSVITSIDWSLPFSVGVWHMTFVATPTDSGEWDVRAEFEPDGIGFFQCTEPCAGDPCRFWEMRGTARTRVLVSPMVATEIAADGCVRRSDCGDRTPVTVYCTFTIDVVGVASVSDFNFQ